MINLDKYQTSIDQNFNWAIEKRRHLHQHPELSFEERETSKYIAKALDEIGIPYVSGIADTGILATINGGSKGKTIAVRADIDALPIQEETSLPYQSVNDGVMHACGHDIHTSNLLYLAKVLWEHKEDINGKILLLFQPGEECFPGGASKILESGILDDKNIEAFLGLHVSPELPAGKIGIRPGMYMASGDEIYIEVKGQGGHAALPQNLDDTVLAASSIVVALQQLVSRIGDARIPTVLSIGKFIANGATNIIPSSVKLEGTFRTMNEEWRAKAHEKIEEIAHYTAMAHHTQAIVEVKKGYPCLTNSPELTSIVRDAFRSSLGADNVIDLDIRMTTEDFGYISNKFPSVFYRLGVGGDSQSSNMLHNSRFVANEIGLKTGAESMLAAIKAVLDA